MSDDRSVRASGHMSANVISTGDHNRTHAELHAQAVPPQIPPANSVDIAAELASIRAILLRLSEEHTNKIGRALDDAEEEAKKKTPDKDEVGTALTRALDYAKQSNEFMLEASKLAPHIAGVVGWLGSTWHHLLPLVGLVNP